MIRTYLVKALYEKLLGPQFGPEEIIEEPFGKYQTGVLTSCFHSKTIDDKTISDPSEKNYQSPGEKSAEYFESTLDNDVQWPDTELDMDGSFTLGLTFVIKSESPKIRICSTWGRYTYVQKIPQNMKVFQREPNYYLTEWLNVESFEKGTVIKLLSDNKGNVVTGGGIELHLRTTRSSGSDDKWTVQVFLVNRTPYPDKDKDGKPKRQEEIHRIFQPQIRINKDKESTIEYLGESATREINEDKEFLAYYERRPKARGFQCGAVWETIDPEGNAAEESFRSFTWPDSRSGLIPKEIIDEFTCPDIRTEYLPPYSILQPVMDERLYDAEFLSREWDRDKIEEHLRPISQEYSNWILEQRSNLKNDKQLSDKLKEAGLENLKGCEESCAEIDKGIDFVCNDERARLAFCFMNAIMLDKRKNDNRKKSEDEQKLFWREFQMGFILQSLRGVAGIDEKAQNLADVLWFPTGGGKTEAYLGITMFAVAYRRLLTQDEIKGENGETLNNDGGVNVISRYTLRLLTIQQFQRALGAFVVADLKRVQNWIPKKLESGGVQFTNENLYKKFLSGHLWGNGRISIGLWIGGDATPTRFAYMRGGNKGKYILNAEGVLLSSRDPLKHPRSYHEPPKGDPAQIHNCPICGNLLCFPQYKQDFESTDAGITWIVKTAKTIAELKSIPKSNFEHPHRIIQLKENPLFSEISESDDGSRYVRVTMKLSIKKNIDDIRDAIDSWWDDYVNQNFISKGINSLVSTRAAMPGYFFLKRSGDSRPYDFAIHCTSESCELNKTEWFENVADKYMSTIPTPFRKSGTGNVSTSVPISAFTIDEQVYARCPTFIIATSDKFANLPWDPRCASIFGNVDCCHRFFGYGRSTDFQAPLLETRGGRSVRMTPDTSEFSATSRFLPPSLIIQDELHLIEGPLGSMVGVYEMAIDLLCRNGTTGPKYIASSATIKEADTLIRTIFRKDIRTFPHPGIYSSDNFFAKTDEDPTCIKEGAGRLYVGICSAKSVFELPIKVCAILMSEIHKIKENPELYGLTKQTVNEKIDPYWTYVSYFSDLQLMSRFSGFYGDDIERDIKKFSPYRMGISQISGMRTFSEGTRIFPIVAESNITIYGLSVYTQNTKGKICAALYDDSGSQGKLLWSSNPKKCSHGENAFLSDEPILELTKGKTIWVGILNDSKETLFRTIQTSHNWFEILNNPGQENMTFQQNVGNTKTINDNSIQVEITGKRRELDESNKIELSSETRSEELPIHLEKLQTLLSADALFTSPVFGTGIDVDRLGLMNIMNQPKTTSAYIQATGRVGRRTPGLVVSWLSARRARDLDHYENFIGYHRKIHSHVEPVTANPFSQESLELSLGPILVAILRNGKSVSGTPISPKWIKNSTGPERITTHEKGNSEEINAVRDSLKKIAANELIPEFRTNHNFAHLIDNQLDIWLKLVKQIQIAGREIIYGERNPTRPVEKDVVLGTDFHEQRGFSAAFSNTKNSLRDTESTSLFFQELAKIAIRPSQFITRYGTGSMLPAESCSVTAPSISDMIADLKEPIGNFAEPVNGKKELNKIEIHDSKMKKMLHRYNQDTNLGDIHIFDMPTNASLNSKTHSVANYDKIYHTRLFPEWATCSKHSGDRVLAKIIHHPSSGKLAVRCPLCQDQFNEMYSTTFSSVRFVVACKNGHMSDVDWNYEIHKQTACSHRSDDDYRVFIWDEAGGGDDISFNCYGVWIGENHDQFEETRCNAQTKYSYLKYESNVGSLNCTGEFVEDHHNPVQCSAKPKIARKSMMSLRSPIILSSLVIQQKKSRLFEKLLPQKEIFLNAKLDLEENDANWTSEDLADRLQKRQSVHRMGDGLILDVRREEKRNLVRVCDDLQKEIEREDLGDTVLTESQGLEEELRSLENGIEPSKQTSGRGSSKSSSVKYPIRWKSKTGFSFEAMPYSDIRVTKVQTGYTREISDVQQDDKTDDQSEKAIQMRLGSIVSKYSRYVDSSTNFRWYLGNQNIGEGIFIHLDPSQHKDSYELFQKSQEVLKDWEDFHNKVSKIADKKLQSKGLKETQRDMIESAIAKSNPLFVWWHSLAHQIITELAIDSGFTTTSLSERVYCVKNLDGTYSTGILIYASTPGSDGTLGGLTSLVDDDILPKIVDRALFRLLTCSNDPVCSERKFEIGRHRGAACHSCIMAPETSCAYLNKFIDRNLIRETL